MPLGSSTQEYIKELQIQRLKEEQLMKAEALLSDDPEQYIEKTGASAVLKKGYTGTSFGQSLQGAGAQALVSEVLGTDQPDVHFPSPTIQSRSDLFSVPLQKPEEDYFGLANNFVSNPFNVPDMLSSQEAEGSYIYDLWSQQQQQMTPIRTIG